MAEEETCESQERATDAQSGSVIKKNTIYNILKTLSSIAFPLITFPYVSRVLLPENIGRLGFSGSIVSYVTLLASLGISTYAIRECGRVKNDRSQLDKTASQIFSINLSSTILAYIALSMLLTLWEQLDGYKLLIVIQSASILFATLGADWVNTAMEDFRYITVRTFASQLVSLICMFIFVHNPEDYYAYALIGVVASSGANLVNIAYRRRYCRLRFTMHMDLRRHLPPVLFLFATMVAQVVYTSTDITILGIYYDDAEVGLYSTAVKVYTIANRTIASVAIVVLPQLSFHFASNNYAEINRILRYSASFITVLGAPCAFGMIVMAPEVVYLIGGADYFGAAPSLRVLSVALLLSLASGLISNTVLIPSGRERVCLIGASASATVNLVANLLLVPVYGSIAAAATTVVAELVGLLIGLHYVEDEIDFGGIYSLIGQPVIGCCSILVIGFTGKILIDNLGIRLAAVFLLSVCAYYIIMRLLGNELVVNIGSSIRRKLAKGNRFGV